MRPPGRPHRPVAPGGGSREKAWAICLAICREKLAPYLRPLYDSPVRPLGRQALRSCLVDGSIESPGRLYARSMLKNAFVVSTVRPYRFLVFIKHETRG